ncbi:UMTA methyltransferase family protein [Colletotrichum tofieldiae]|nr:UMTA methyltransferase family protein [Colletotrichum tofieldiae]GKT70623.1 UMTA methyltransferase family protein [Colletotrichum tofieldiae]GKT94504.1 UMTA methyltransferase family protein [Colletotrichum tofieldiae]
MADTTSDQPTTTAPAPAPAGTTATTAGTSSPPASSPDPAPSAAAAPAATDEQDVPLEADDEGFGVRFFRPPDVVQCADSR